MITQDQVKELFNYDPNTGILTNRIDRSSRSKKGDAVGYLSTGGYLAVMVYGKQYRVHRIIFLWWHGYLPKQVDHVYGDRENNRIKDLRAATNGKNQRNARISKNNTSGFKGVWWDKSNRKYRASLYYNGKDNSLGYFDDPEVAAQVVMIERVNNHGEFCNHG